MADDRKEANADTFVQIFLLEVEIMRGIDLKAADLNGKSDPYVRVSSLGKTYQTKTIMKTLNPKWNEKTQFCFFSDPVSLKFEVFDWDKVGKDDELGSKNFSLAGFFDAKHAGFRGTIKLENVKKGEVEIAVKGKKLLPIEMEKRGTQLMNLTATQRETLDQEEAQIAKLTDSNDELSGQVEQLRAEEERLVEDDQQLHDKLASLEEEAGKLRQEVHEVETERNEAQEALEQRRQAVRAVLAEIEKCDTERKDKKKEERKLNGDVERLNQDVETRKKQKADEEAAAASRKKKQQQDEEKAKADKEAQAKAAKEKEKEKAKAQEKQKETSGAGDAKAEDKTQAEVQKATQASSGGGCCVVL